jgi:signal recognition particle receptor subunit alpha
VIVIVNIFLLIFIAKDKKFDVVLIDTAGRMENDEPLMKALAKVII